MAFNMHNRSLLSLMHHTQRELRFLLDLSRDLKRAKYTGTEQQHLKGKNIALIFEKTSTRTRCAFEVAAYDQGANVTYIDPTSSQIGHKESMKDTARVLGRMFDAIEYRGFGQEIVEELAKFAGVPVFNGLTAEFHPTQMIADVLTMLEHSDKPLHQISYAYLGDARYNMGNSLLMNNKLDESIDAYKEALRNNPGDLETKYNLLYAMNLKKKQEEQKKNQDKNKDQNKDQDKNKDKNQDQNKDQKKDQNKNQDQQNKDQQQQPQQSKISKQNAEQMLQALENSEKKTQEKVKKIQAMKAQSKKVEKDW